MALIMASIPSAVFNREGNLVLSKFGVGKEQLLLAPEHRSHRWKGF